MVVKERELKRMYVVDAGSQWVVMEVDKYGIHRVVEIVDK